MKTSQKQIVLIIVITMLLMLGCSNANQIMEEDSIQDLPVQPETNEQANQQEEDDLLQEESVNALSDVQVTFLQNVMTSDIKDRIQMYQADLASSNKATISDNTSEISADQDQNDDNPKEVAKVESTAPTPSPAPTPAPEPTPEPTPPPAPFTPVRVSGLGNSGMEFITMAEADTWAGDQFLNPGSPWYDEYTGWFTTSVAYQIDALGNVNHSYRFTVDFYK